MKKNICVLCLSIACFSAYSADYKDGDIHKNDSKWINFKLMYALNELPTTYNADHNSHDYLEMEFGGRSGYWSLYGYIDVFNLANRDNGDKSDSADKMYMKLTPRLSLDALTGHDFSYGPVKELFLATEFNWNGNNGGTNNSRAGVGADVMVPWFGKVGTNLTATYNMNRKGWNGYKFSANWFKPFYTFSNSTFLSYQGYINSQFAMRYNPSSYDFVMYNGFYWNTERFAVGYGLKLFKDVYGLRNGAETANGDKIKSTGVGHYLDLTYKF